MWKREPLGVMSGLLRASWMISWASVFLVFRISMLSFSSVSSDSYRREKNGNMCTKGECGCSVLLICCLWKMCSSSQAGNWTKILLNQEMWNVYPLSARMTECVEWLRTTWTSHRVNLWHTSNFQNIHVTCHHVFCWQDPRQSSWVDHVRIFLFSI